LPLRAGGQYLEDREVGMNRMLITGASRGIGQALARRYLAAGWKVFGSCRNLEAAGIRELQSEFGERFAALSFDVRDGGAVRQAARETAAMEDGLELLINNAGIAPQEPGHGAAEVDETQLSLAFDVNVLGPLRVLKAFYPLLEKGRDPKVVMISSIVGSMGLTRGGGSIPYCVSKASLNMLTLLMHFRLREKGIPIAAVHPGWVRTDMGGQGGELSPEESAGALAEVIERLSLDSPVYMDYRGKELPW
jgi:NAD(P)-dependent dehydrogenase (short-subunit alcohol dehydrogenase family)